MDDAALRHLHDAMFERMRLAGWVKSYHSGRGGYCPVWTADGILGSKTLKAWYRMLDLGHDNFRPILAIGIAHGVPLDSDSNPDAHAALAPYVASGLAIHAGFSAADGLKIRWTDAGVAFCAGLRAIAADLHLPLNEDSALTLFSICDTWAPGDDMPISTNN